MKRTLHISTDCWGRLLCALDFIENRLDQPLSLAAIAAHCHISPFHFHRLFHSAVNETLGQYVRRLRLEWAAQTLLYTDDSVETIALAVGYESAAVFQRAFKHQFGLAPATFRARVRNALEAQISRVDGATRAEGLIAPTHYRSLPAQRFAYVRCIGPYRTTAAQAWSALRSQPQLASLFGNATDWIGIAHDNPHVTDESRLRYDACLPVPDNIVADGDLGIRYQQAGYYAVFTPHAAGEDVWQTYAAIYGSWLLRNGRRRADAPAMALYSSEVNRPRFEICIPLIDGPGAVTNRVVSPKDAQGRIGATARVHSDSRHRPRLSLRE